MQPVDSARDPDILAPPHAYLPFRTAAVLGAGTMGSQIAAHLANAGLDVLLFDVAADEAADTNAVVDRALSRTKKMKPAPFFDEEAAGRIATRNFEEHLERLATVEWVVEAVVERLDVKRSLLKRVESVMGPETIVSTNTSGLSIAEIAEGRSDSFRRRFLGTHFFNPPRYLKLLELVPSDATDPDVIARIAHFGRIHLGKGVVVARDTPYFIGNRIGMYAMLQAMRAFTDGEYTIEEIDALTGPVAGRPKSATFRTADVVGLDVMLDVAQNLYAAVPDDESREAFLPPNLLERLVEAERRGQKSGAGFYKKEDGEIKSVDPESLNYSSAPELQLPELGDVDQSGSTADRLKALYEAGGRTGAFVRRTTLNLLAYSARQIPAITENPADVDRAIRWGFGWELGPFEIWDVLGFERVLDDMREDGLTVPAWIERLRNEDRAAIYRRDAGRAEVYIPTGGAYEADPRPQDHISLEIIKADGNREIWASDVSGLLDVGEGVALFEFRSKANTLGQGVMADLRHVIELVETDREFKGLVIGNEGSNFSVGANLAELAGALKEGRFDDIHQYLTEFQDTVQRVHYARKPVVVAVHQRVLGGGCELVMACPHPVAAAESYVGLVELGVGLIPAGTGTMRLAAMAEERSPSGHPSEIQAWLQNAFETVAMSKVSTSAPEAQKLQFLPAHTRIVMNNDRRLYVAKEEVLRLSHEGYRPPVHKARIKVLGRPAAAAFDVMVQQYVEGRHISEYDAFLANRLAFVVTGGDLTAPQEVDESYLIGLEREVFVDLVRGQRTQDRIEHMLKTKKPLRN